MEQLSLRYFICEFTDRGLVTLSLVLTTKVRRRCKSRGENGREGWNLIIVLSMYLCMLSRVTDA